MLKTALSAILLALPAAASTIAITSDQTTYQAGETITLTITGDAQGAGTSWIFGELVYSSVLTDTISSTQTILTTDGVPWIYGPTLVSDGRAYVWNQIGGISGDTALFPTPDGPAVSTVQLVGVYGGTVELTWTDELAFFGISSSPGYSITIVGDSPPPPPPTVEQQPPPAEEPLPPPPPPPTEEQPPPPPPPLADEPLPPAGDSGGAAPVPEPSGVLIFSAGLLGARLARTRRAALSTRPPWFRESSPPRRSRSIARGGESVRG
jgi:hypothetical protein